MKEEAKILESMILAAELQLKKMEDAETALKSSPENWSKKEILGHLIDSAANNHQRIVRALYNAAEQFPVYNQNEWVRVQKYNEMKWHILLDFWKLYNIHVSSLIKIIPQESKSAQCNIGSDEPVSLEFLVNDYIGHLQHHLEVILK